MNTFVQVKNVVGLYLCGFKPGSGQLYGGTKGDTVWGCTVVQTVHRKFQVTMQTSFITSKIL